MASPLDIVAMKLNAISGNGTRLKDYIDVAHLSSWMTLSAYECKYSSRNPTMVIKSLAYHEDINFDEPIEMVEGKHKWYAIKLRLEEMSLHPNELFNPIY